VTSNLVTKLAHQQTALLLSFFFGGIVRGEDLGVAPMTGQTFGNYQVVGLIGEGGFGEVYEAWNQFLQRRAAIKVLRKGMVEEPELVSRFLNEARAASAIQHPNIVEVLDAGVTPEGEPYILMELLEGDSLEKRLRKDGRMAVRVVQEIARQAGSALSAAHAAGIVHRDLKPENIFLVPDPASPMGFRVKVLDFGIAKVRPRENWGSTVKTKAGLLMGSPSYMSPEQCRDSSDVDLRSDIYSLAVMVYEMLAGVPPFGYQTAADMLVLKLTADPAPLLAAVPDYVEQAVMRALSKERDLRYDSVDYFVGVLLGTYPALTSQGSAVFAGSACADPKGTAVLPAIGDGDRQAPSPGAVSERTIGAGLLTGTAFKPNPSATTLSRTTGESMPSSEGLASNLDLQSVRSRRWPTFAVVGAVAAGIAVILFLRVGGSPSPIVAAQSAVSENVGRVGPGPAPSAMVHVRIGSSPAGATVVDGKEGAVLGQTPLEKFYPQGDGAVGVVLRLAGYKDKSVTIGLHENSSTSVILELNETVRPEIAKKPVATQAEHSSGVKVRKPPPKPTQGKEDEWRAY
jgi:serine/threonine-protein kinase